MLLEILEQLAYLEMFLKTVTAFDWADRRGVHGWLFSLTFHFLLSVFEALVVLGFFAHVEVCLLAEVLKFVLLYRSFVGFQSLTRGQILIDSFEAKACVLIRPSELLSISRTFVY